MHGPRAVDHALSKIMRYIRRGLPKGPAAEEDKIFSLKELL
jgi:hypothetical protein